jgi:putative RecB family exonuclease
MNRFSDNLRSTLALPALRLSYSKLTRWEECPKSFHFHYILKLFAAGGDAALLGTVVHETGEKLERDFIARGVPGSLSRREAAAVYTSIAKARRLVGIESFQDGWQMVQDFVVDRGWREPNDILAIELPFEMQVGGFVVVGVIDRVERRPDGILVVIDLKSKRLLFSTYELPSNLQLSLYDAAVRQLWPDAPGVSLAMWMLRHRELQYTSRTPEQREAALAYVEMLGEQISTATEYPARLGPHCGYCDYRHRCEDYQEVVAGKRTVTAADVGDLQSVAREREQLVAISSLVDKRKSQLDRVLKKHLKDEPELVAGSTRLRLYQTTTLDHDLAKSASTIERATGIPAGRVAARIGTVDKAALGKLLDEQTAVLGRPRAELLRHELEALATVHKGQRLWATPASKGVSANSAQRSSSPVPSAGRAPLSSSERSKGNRS